MFDTSPLKQYDGERARIKRASSLGDFEYQLVLVGQKFDKTRSAKNITGKPISVDEWSLMTIEDYRKMKVFNFFFAKLKIFNFVKKMKILSENSKLNQKCLKFQNTKISICKNKKKTKKEDEELSSNFNEEEEHIDMEIVDFSKGFFLFINIYFLKKIKKTILRAKNIKKLLSKFFLNRFELIIINLYCRYDDGRL